MRKRACRLRVDGRRDHRKPKGPSLLPAPARPGLLRGVFSILTEAWGLVSINKVLTELS